MARLSACGHIDGDQLLQAKGRTFTTAELLGGDFALAGEFADGEFCTVYLAPRDYHRVHMPLAGTLRSMTHVPGRLFSVQGATARQIDRLFARNERLVCVFDTACGPLAVVLVGALLVSSISTVWAGQINPHGERRGLWRKTYPASGEGSVQLPRGAELGHFAMGSTVILLLPPGAFGWDGADARRPCAALWRGAGRVAVCRRGRGLGYAAGAGHVPPNEPVGARPARDRRALKSRAAAIICVRSRAWPAAQSTGGAPCPASNETTTAAGCPGHAAARRGGCDEPDPVPGRPGLHHVRPWAGTDGGRLHAPGAHAKAGAGRPAGAHVHPAAGGAGHDRSVPDAGGVRDRPDGGGGLSRRGGVEPVDAPGARRRGAGRDADRPVGGGGGGVGAGAAESVDGTT